MSRTGDSSVASNVLHGSSALMSKALSYLREVRETFYDQTYKHDMFLKILKDDWEQRRDTSETVAQVKELFKGYNNLITGFNNFLPPEHKIPLEDEPKIPLDEEKERPLEDEDEEETSFISTARDY
ncbi:paired amphipathic helix protein Sin3-like 2 [Capsella rubella]|uniref:paired amphipathic helix protein Sin3-like 2 n=1 Tax=Capsella rubella TaxID=81985 RepID=UPI000CD5A7CB|nr:paired amphipathic helix protein Sin3-like 2 [Capsella rubella]